MQSQSDSTEMGHGNPSPTKTPVQGHKKNKSCCAGVFPTPPLPWKGLGGHSYPREVMGMEGDTSCKDRSLRCAARVIVAQLPIKAGNSPQGHHTAGSIHWTGMSRAGASVLTPPHTPMGMDGNGVSEPGSAVTLPGLGMKRKETPKGSEGHVMKQEFPCSWILWLPKAVAAPCK